ncbi:MAG TPA: hypothetical protein VEL76_06690 [Gemmataceae bacterium]|nr:hypothetical protein [Gemmataceae bacterium]
MRKVVILAAAFIFVAGLLSFDISDSVASEYATEDEAGLPAGSPFANLLDEDDDSSTLFVEQGEQQKKKAVPGKKGKKGTPAKGKKATKKPGAKKPGDKKPGAKKAPAKKGAELSPNLDSVLESAPELVSSRRLEIAELAIVRRPRTFPD